MAKEKRANLDSRMVALVAVLIAVTTVLTIVVRIPIAPTRGYITLADVAVYFAAFSLGPWVGGIAGGIGTGLADAIAGYPQWMVFSLIIHGCQGIVAGLIARAGGYKLKWMLLAWVPATVIMVGGYFSVSAFLYGVGPAAIEIPGNLIQNVAGGVVGIPLVFAVRKAYPPINQVGKKQKWEES